MKVGDKVVCVKTHSLGAVIKDKTYIIKSLSICKCNHVIDVGVLESNIHDYCPMCKTREPYQNDVWWIAKKLFRPLKLIRKTNKLTKKLANHQQENLEIYVPLEVETPVEV